MSLNLAPKVLRGVIDLLRIHRCVALAGEALSFGNRIAYPVSRGVSGEVVVGGHSAKTTQAQCTCDLEQGIRHEMVRLQ